MAVVLFNGDCAELVTEEMMNYSVSAFVKGNAFQLSNGICLHD